MWLQSRQPIQVHQRGGCCRYWNAEELWGQPMCWGAAACGWNRLGPLERALGWGEKERHKRVKLGDRVQGSQLCLHPSPVQARDGPEGLVQELSLGSPSWTPHPDMSAAQH